MNLRWIKFIWLSLHVNSDYSGIASLGGWWVFLCVVLIQLFKGKWLPSKDNSFPTSHIKLLIGLYHCFFLVLNFCLHKKIVHPAAFGPTRVSSFVEAFIDNKPRSFILGSICLCISWRRGKTPHHHVVWSYVWNKCVAVGCQHWDSFLTRTATYFFCGFSWNSTV